MDKAQRHLRRIGEAINELTPLSDTTREPASMQFQYIGTLIDNTLVMLTAVANSLDGGGRNIQFSEFRNWVSAMQAVHRSFYNSVILVVEKGLVDYCNKNNINVVSSRKYQAQSIIASIEKNHGQLSTRERNRIIKLAGESPSFIDFVRTVSKAKINPNKQNVWIKFFEGLVIVRNKSSHSDASLSQSEQTVLKDGGLGALVSSSGVLQLNPRNYKQIVEFIMQFYREVETD